MEQVLSILQVVSIALIVPLINVIKARWIPPEWAFLAWALQLILSFGVAAGLIALMVDVWTWPQVWEVAMTIMVGTSAFHAGEKTYYKMKMKRATERAA